MKKGKSKTKDISKDKSNKLPVNENFEVPVKLKKGKNNKNKQNINKKQVTVMTDSERKLADIDQNGQFDIDDMERELDSYSMNQSLTPFSSQKK